MHELRRRPRPCRPAAVAVRAHDAGGRSRARGDGADRVRLDVAERVADGVDTGTTPPASTAGQAVVNLVRGEVGVAESPPGSNDSPRIAQFRQATAGSGVGPWCAYFTSWAGREAGVPLGESGQGFGRVDDVYAWAQRAGKAIPNGRACSRSPAI